MKNYIVLYNIENRIWVKSFQWSHLTQVDYLSVDLKISLYLDMNQNQILQELQSSEVNKYERF